MKKWQIGLIIAFAGILLVVFVGIMTYRFFVLPRYVEPMIEEISEYIKNDDVLDDIYEQAIALHDEGVMDDETYSNFIRMYEIYTRDDEEYARGILDAKEMEMGLESEKNNNNSVSARYASRKVGTEMIKEKDGSGGKADVRYSDERNSNRIQAEDVVEAEKILEEVEASETEEATQTPDIVQSAYDKLRVNMSTSEFQTFVKIMSKLDIDTLKTYMNDKEGLKYYLHRNLSDDEYKSAVNLGYKYIYLFLARD